MTWGQEYSQIRTVAEEYGVDPRFIAAIRKHENGGPGREFGILSVNAPDFTSQLNVCCATVRGRVADFKAALYVLTQTKAGPRRLTYSPGFISHFAFIYCPVGASNDPTGLNKNWLGGVSRIYLGFVKEGV